MKKGLMVLFIFAILLAGTVHAVKVTCYDTGAIFIESNDRGDVYAKKKGDKKYFDVPGTWRPAEKKQYFISEEAVFVNLNETSYTIKLNDRTYTAKCPEFVFSCKILNLSIETCYKREELFVGKYFVTHVPVTKELVYKFTNPFLLTYEVVTSEKKELTHGPQILSPEFKTINMSRVKKENGNRYILRWETPYNITRFKVEYKDCGTMEKYDFYKSMECSNVPFCEKNEQCLSDEFCNEEENVCERMECGECQYAENHECADYKCCTDNDCREEEYCTNHSCTSVTCKEGEIVTNHTCSKIICKEDEYLEDKECKRLGCKENEYAENHQCKALNCKETEAAQNHECVALNCGFLKKAANHKCMNVIPHFFKNLFGS